MRHIFLPVLLFLIFLSISASLYLEHYNNNNFDSAREIKKIISLSPSVTETLYFMGYWDKVVGVTRYCTFPSEASSVAKVGGIFDINYEVLISINPDLVILTSMQQDISERLTSLGIMHIVVDHSTYSGVKNSFLEIETIVGKSQTSQEFIKKFNDDVSSIMIKLDGLERNKTGLFVLFRDPGPVKSVSVLGNDGYYSELMNMLGIINPFGKFASYPSVTKEGIVWVDPDIIFELKYPFQTADSILADWQHFNAVSAVKNNNICIISESYGYVPGPRFPLLLRDAANCVYPEVF